MNGIDKIIGRISGDAQTEIDAILAHAREQAEQIAQRSQDPDHVYWGGDEYSEAFTSIRDNQPFYLNEAGRPVVLFEKYEIAPGYMGVQEFEIPS